MLEIEIVETNIIEGGVEVFARAWQDGVQIGFGADGTVDIERFRFINPPILVPDTLGTIEIVSTDSLTNEVTVTTYREDPEEAILQVVERVILVMKNAHGNGNIIPGKTGKTTTTEFPSFDGAIGSRTTTWSGFRSGADLLTTTTSANLTVYVGVGCYYQTSGNSWQGDKAFINFSTTAVGTDTVSSATLDLYTANVVNDDNNGNDYIVVVESTAPDASLSTADWSNAGSTAWSDTVDMGTMSIGAYITFTLNATGIAAIDGAGVTTLAIRSGDELLDAQPTLSNGQGNRVAFVASDTAGTTQDPKFIIEHTAAATNAVKSINGLSNVS